MRKGFVLLMALVGLAMSCGDRNMNNAFESDVEDGEDSVEAFVGDTLHLFDEEMPPVAADELFDDFFFNFIDDARYRLRRIAFPLQCGEGEVEEKHFLSKGEWQELDPFGEDMFHFVIYEREQDLELLKDTAVGSVSVERIFLRQGRLEMFEFNRIAGKWMLTGMHEENMLNTPNGDFLRFYARFVTDSLFQRESLASPVKVILTAIDEEEEAQEEFVTKDEWFEMQDNTPLFNDVLMNIDYGQTCISQNRKTLMLEGVCNGLQMKFRFNKQEDEWMLMEVEY